MGKASQAQSPGPLLKVEEHPLPNFLALYLQPLIEMGLAWQVTTTCTGEAALARSLCS